MKIMKNQKKQGDNERILNARQHYERFNFKLNHTSNKEVLDYRRQDFDEIRRIKAEEIKKNRKEKEQEEAFERSQRMINEFKKLIEIQNFQISNTNNAEMSIDNNIQRNKFEEKLLEYEEVI